MIAIAVRENGKKEIGELCSITSSVIRMIGATGGSVGVLTLCLIAGVTILLSLTVFLNLVAETLPQVSDAIPLLGTLPEPILSFYSILYSRSILFFTTIISMYFHFTCLYYFSFILLSSIYNFYF